jgi:hypothetical protein
MKMSKQQQTWAALFALVAGSVVLTKFAKGHAASARASRRSAMVSRGSVARGVMAMPGAYGALTSGGAGTGNSVAQQVGTGAGRTLPGSGLVVVGPAAAPLDHRAVVREDPLGVLQGAPRRSAGHPGRSVLSVLLVPVRSRA